MEKFVLSKSIKTRRDNNAGVMVRIPHEMVKLLAIAPGQKVTLYASLLDKSIVIKTEDSANEV